MPKHDLHVELLGSAPPWCLCVENNGATHVTNVTVGIVDARTHENRSDLLPSANWWGLAAGNAIDLVLTSAPPAVIAVELTWTRSSGAIRRRRQVVHCEERPLPRLDGIGDRHDDTLRRVRASGLTPPL